MEPRAVLSSGYIHMGAKFQDTGVHGDGLAAGMQSKTKEYQDYVQ